MKIKKLWILLTIGMLTTVIVGCTARKQDSQIEKMTNLAQILVETTKLTEQFQNKEITAEQFNTLSLELQDKYEQLTHLGPAQLGNNTETGDEELEKLQNNLDEQFETMKKTIDNTKEPCEIPEWAEKLGITKPEGLSEEKNQCKQTSVDAEGFDSVSLAYQGSYETAMQQAKIIADKAKIQISPEFKMAQDALSGLTAEEIYQITSGSMLKGIVYSNFGLLATDIDYLITISVDENGRLIVEVINYEQMKK